MSKITVYHGSKEKLTLNNISREYGNGVDDGVGFYTTTEIARAQEYGDVITQFEIELKKEASHTKITLPDSVIKEMIVNTNFQENYGEPYGSITMEDIINEALESLKEEEGDTDIIGSIINAQDEVDPVFEALEKAGYNHCRGKQFHENIIVYILSDLVEVPFKGVKESASAEDVFDYTSEEFKTVANMNKEKNKLIEELCKFLGVDRKSFRLQRGNVRLQALTKEGNWINITSLITEFPRRVRTFEAESFRLRTKLAKRK